MSLEDLTIMERCAKAVVSYVKYIVMTFWPANLAFYYPYPAAIPPGQIIGAVAIVITVTTIVIRAGMAKLDRCISGRIVL